MVSAQDQKTRVSNGPRTESYETIRVSRNRAYLLALAAWPVAAIALAALFVSKANEAYVPPVVLTIDQNNHVAKSEIGTPEVLLAKDSIIESELARYITERFTLDRRFRDDHIAYVRLHSSGEVDAQFEHEMDPKNKENPYYSIGETTVRRLRDVRIRILDSDEKKAEATFMSFNEGAVTSHPIYWHVLFRYDFVKQALTPQNRYINGNGFMVTAFASNTEPGPPAP